MHFFFSDLLLRIGIFNSILKDWSVQNADCRVQTGYKMQTADCRLQTRYKMQTE